MINCHRRRPGWATRHPTSDNKNKTGKLNLEYFEGILNNMDVPIRLKFRKTWKKLFDESADTMEWTKKTFLVILKALNHLSSESQNLKIALSIRPELMKKISLFCR